MPTPTFISVLQLIPTLFLLYGTLMLVNVELSDVVPAANDNASGVATALCACGASSTRARPRTST